MRIPAIVLVLYMTASGALAAGPNGAWHWTTEGGTFVARTTSASGETLGQTCRVAEKRCYWLIGLKRGCTGNATHPVLASTDVGSTTFELACTGQTEDGIYQYSINEFDNVDDLLARAQQLGFAIPLQGDRFLVVKFDMNGAKPVVEAMRKAALAQMQAQSK
jgi:hypothetical protein